MTWWSDLREHADVAEVWDSQATVFWGLIAVGLFTFWAGIGYAWLIIRFILWLFISILNLLLAISGYQIPLPANTWRDSVVNFVLKVFSHLSIDWTIFWIGAVLVGIYTSWELWPPRISERLLGPRHPPDENYVSPLMQVKANEKQQVPAGPERRSSLSKNLNIISPQQRAQPRVPVTDEDSQFSAPRIAHVRAGYFPLERFKDRFWNWILYICPPLLTNIIAFVLLLLPRPQTAILLGLLVLYFINSKTGDTKDYIPNGGADISKLPQALWTIFFSISWLWAFLVPAFFIGASIWGLKNTSLSGFLLFSLFVLKVLWLMWKQSFPDFPWIDLLSIITPYWPWYLLATLSGLAFMFIVNTGIATPLFRLQELYHWFQRSINIRSTEKVTQAEDGKTQPSPRIEHSPTTPPSSMLRGGLFPGVPDDDDGNGVPAAKEPVPSPKIFLAYVPKNDIRKVLRWLLVAFILGALIVYSFWFAPRQGSKNSSSGFPGMARPEFPVKSVSPVKPSIPLDTATLGPGASTSVRTAHPYSPPLYAHSISTPKTSLESPRVNKKGRLVKSSNRSPGKTVKPPGKLSPPSSEFSPAGGSGSSIRGRHSDHSHTTSSATREGWPVRKKDNHYTDLSSAPPSTTSIKAPSEAYSVTSSTSHKGYIGRKEDDRSSDTSSATSSQAPSKKLSTVASKKRKGWLGKDKDDKATTKGGWSDDVVIASETQSARRSSSKKSSRTTSANTYAKTTSKYTPVTPSPKSPYASDRTEFAPDTRPYPSAELGLCQYCQLAIHDFTFLLKVVFTPITRVIFPILRFILNFGGFYEWISYPWDILSPFRDYDTFGEFITALPGDVWDCVSDESCLLSGSMTIFYVALTTAAVIVLGYFLKLANKVPQVLILGRIAIWLPLPWLAFFFFGWFKIPRTLVDEYFGNGWSVMFLILFGLKVLKTGTNLISYFFLDRKVPVPKNPVMGPEDVTIIIPIGKNDAANPHFRDVIISMLRNNPWEIMIVAEDSPTWSAVRRSLDNIGGQWTCYMFRRCHPTRPGLRRADPAKIQHTTRRQMVEYGIRDSQTAITCIADWNAVWPTNFIRNTLATFEDPVVFALGTTQTLKRGEGEGSKSFRSLQNFLASVNNERQNFSNTCAHSIDGGVSLLPNSTWFARTETLYTLPYRQGLLNESWLSWIMEMYPGESYWSSRFFTNGGYKIAWYHPQVIDRPVATVYDRNTTLQTLIRDQRAHWRYILESLYHDAVVWRRYPWSTFSLFWSKFFDNQVFLYACLFISRYLSGSSTFNACALWALIFLNDFFGRGFVVVWRTWMEYLNPTTHPVTTRRDLLRDVAFWVASGTVWQLVEGVVVYWSLVTCWVVEEVKGSEE